MGSSQVDDFSTLDEEDLEIRYLLYSPKRQDYSLNSIFTPFDRNYTAGITESPVLRNYPTRQTAANHVDPVLDATVNNENVVEANHGLSRGPRNSSPESQPSGLSTPNNIGADLLGLAGSPSVTKDVLQAEDNRETPGTNNNVVEANHDLSRGSRNSSPESQPPALSTPKNTGADDLRSAGSPSATKDVIRAEDNRETPGTNNNVVEANHGLSRGLRNSSSECQPSGLSTPNNFGADDLGSTGSPSATKAVLQAEDNRKTPGTNKRRSGKAVGWHVNEVSEFVEGVAKIPPGKWTIISSVLSGSRRTPDDLRKKWASLVRACSGAQELKKQEQGNKCQIRQKMKKGRGPKLPSYLVERILEVAAKHHGFRMVGTQYK